MRITTLLFFISCSAPLLAQPTRSGRDHAVFFYVTTFQPGWAALPETKTEAEALKAELESNFGFACELVANPTKQQMLDKIRQYNERLTGNDQVLFFFSMHGHFDTAGDRGYLIGKDGLLRDDYGDTWLNYDDLRTNIARSKAKHVLLALDACHSGSFGIRNKGRPDEPIVEAGLDCAARVSNTMRYAGRQYCTSGNKDAKTPAKSLFAARFLEALRIGGEKGFIEFNDIEYWLGKVDTPKPESGSFSIHEPGGDFVFVRKGACNATPATANPSTQRYDPEKDFTAWKTAKHINTTEAFNEYLRLFPKGEFSERAQKALQELERVMAIEDTKRHDDLAWAIAVEKKTVEAFQKYQKDWPAGIHKEQAAVEIALLNTLDNFIRIPGESFFMGSIDGEGDEKPEYSTKVKDFYLGKFEVTVAEFRAFIKETGYTTDAEKQGFTYDYSFFIAPVEEKKPKGRGPSDSYNHSTIKKRDYIWYYGADGNMANDMHPVINVSWNDATAYCQWLSRKTGQTYRLPTEEEWEFAAGNGKKQTRYSWGNGDPSEEKGGNIADATFKKRFTTGSIIFQGYADNHIFTAPVGSFSPNDLGLYDMTGNVWEWCADLHKPYISAKQGTGVSFYGNYIVRGGSWAPDPKGVRVENREGGRPDFRCVNVGFRVARSAD